MRRRTLPLAALLIVLPGCLGEGPIARERRHAFTAALADYLIRPQQISAPRGRLTVTVVNHGRLVHTLRLRARGRVVLSFTTIRPGGSRTRSVRLGRGRYEMLDAIGNYAELGMRGTLVVR